MKIRIDSELKVVEFWAVDQEIPKVTGGSVKKYGPEYLIHTFIKPRLRRVLRASILATNCGVSGDGE